MFKDTRNGTTYLTIGEVARRWECRPENVSRFHCKVGGLGALQSGRAMLVSLQDLTIYEGRLKKATEGKIKKLQRLLDRLNKPVEETV